MLSKIDLVFVSPARAGIGKENAEKKTLHIQQ